MLGSGVQQNDPDIYIHTYTHTHIYFFQILCHYRFFNLFLFWLHQVLVAALRIFNFHGSMQDLLVAACDLLVVTCRKSHGQRSLAGYRGSAEHTHGIYFHDQGLNLGPLY